MKTTLLLIPLISALIGWGTNLIAVRMIFRPYNPWKFFGITIQGLIPRRRGELARKISETVSEHLLSHDDIIENFKSIDLDTNFRKIIDAKLDDFINKRLFSFFPMLAGFIDDSIREKIKDIIIEEVIDLLPELSEKMTHHLEDHFDIRKIVEDKINAFDLHKLETIILQIAKRELKSIEILGGILGGLIGVGQLFLINFL